MPYVKNGDVKIYYEVEGKGKGPPLVMIHGLMRSLEDIKEARDFGALKNDYQIILLDLRGHGKSDKPHDIAKYAVENMVGDIIAVLDKLGIKTANFYGYSYGGGMCFELARYVPERIRSMIVGGAGAQKPPPEIYDLGIKSLKSRMEIIALKYTQGVKVSPGDARLFKNDVEAITAVGKAIGYSPSLMDDLPRMNIPFLIFAGEFDPGFSGAKETSELLPDATFFSLPGDHISVRVDLVVPHIKEFLSRVNKQGQ